MNVLKLDENFRIESDAYNFTLKSEFKRFDEQKNKEVVSRNEYHFPSLKSALLKYLDECLRPIESVDFILLEILRIEDIIKAIK